MRCRMFSPEAVAALEQKTGGKVEALEAEVERLRKLVAFYQGEGPSHEIEAEYRKLADIPPLKRKKAQVRRLLILARVLSRAVDAEHQAFKAELDKAFKDIEAEVDRELAR